MNDVAPDETTAGNNEPTLDDFLNKWEAQKEALDVATKEKRAIEDAIVQFGFLQRHPMSNGSKSTNSAEFKTSLKDEKKAKLRRDEGADWGDVWNVCNDAGLTDDDMPVKLVREVDVKKLDAIQEQHPELYLKLCELIERYQARPSFSVKRV